MPLPLYPDDPGKVIRLSLKMDDPFKSLPIREAFLFKGE
jgi:hypothetical protein